MADFSRANLDQSVGRGSKNKKKICLSYFFLIPENWSRLVKKKKKKKERKNGRFLILSVYYLDLLQLFFYFMSSNFHF